MLAPINVIYGAGPRAMGQEKGPTQITIAAKSFALVITEAIPEKAALDHEKSWQIISIRTHRVHKAIQKHGLTFQNTLAR